MPAFSFLIADPSQAIQTFARQQLQLLGFDTASITAVSTPRTALEAAAELKPNFLLTDTFAKEAMSGMGLHNAVLKHSPHCNFALLGTHSSPTEQAEAHQAGAFFLLAKPFTADQFRDALLQALKRLAQTHPQIAQQIEQQFAKRTHAKTATEPPKIVLPTVPHYKSGDQVSYLNRRETVKDVILRRGELVVHLHGITGMVEASKLQRL